MANNMIMDNVGSVNGNSNLMKGGKRGRKGSRRATRKMKGGKRKLSGYMKFTMSERKKLPKTMKFTQQGKELGKRWHALSDAEKKKF